MDPGELDKVVGLVRQAPDGRDAAGAPVDGRVEFARVWAKVVHPGGREFLTGDGQATERKVVFRIWARPDVDTDILVAFGGQDHEVQDLRPFDDVTELHTIVKAPVAT